MPTPLADMPLEWHVNQASDLAQKTRRSLNADLEPMMHLVMPDSMILIVQFAGPHQAGDIASAARAVVAEKAPRYAILIQEGWTVKRSLMPSDARTQITDPDVRAVLAGRLRPSKLPPHKRGEELVVYGESADGDSAWATYAIEGQQFIPNLSSRDWAATPSTAKAFITRFHPLFVAEAMVRDLDPLERAMFEVEHGSPEALLTHTRETSRVLLAAGALDTPVAYNREADALYARVRKAMGWRGA